jgi:hypothetical protein
MDADQPTLPGLDEDTPMPSGRLVAEVRSTLRTYRDAGLITARDAARVALCLELAQIIEVKRRGGRLSTVHNDARLLDEILCSFVGEGQEVDEKLREAMTAWSAEVEAEKRAGKPHVL